MPQTIPTNGDRTLSGLDLASVFRPTPVDGTGADAPENSEVRRIADDLLAALKYSFAAVAANPDLTLRNDTVESLFQQALRTKAPDERLRIARTAQALTTITPEARVAVFGRAGERDAIEHIGAAGGFDRFSDGLPPLAIEHKLLGRPTPTVTVPRTALTSVADGLLIARGDLPSGFEEVVADATTTNGGAPTAFESVAAVNEARLTDVWGALDGDDLYATATEFEGAVTDAIGFWVTRVRCADETNPEFWGDDEIALAGVSVDETGDTKKIGETYIGGGFEDGSSRSYPNWRYHDFSLSEGTKWPKTYVMTLLLAEKDNGGLSNILNEIWVKVGAEVKRAISAAVGAVVSAYVGAAIGKAIGEAVAWILDQLVNWIISAFKDDVFPAAIAKVTTPSMSARWYYPNGTWGNPSSGLRTMHFYGHGGHYTVDYFWQFHS